MNRLLGTKNDNALFDTFIGFPRIFLQKSIPATKPSHKIQNFQVKLFQFIKGLESSHNQTQNMHSWERPARSSISPNANTVSQIQRGKQRRGRNTLSLTTWKATKDRTASIKHQLQRGRLKC